MIILGVDLGDRRVGFALSDEEERLAVPSGFAAVKSAGEALAAVLDKAERERAELLVLGHPLNMDGRPGPKAREAEEFCRRLSEAGRETRLWDERLTTAEASRLLRSAGLDRRRRRSRVDAQAAQRLLESFLACRRRSSGPVEG